MVDVILSSDNVTVLGGPSRLEVDLNIGASGSRGSLFFTGTQNPNTLNPNQDFPEIPIIFDIFINVNAASENYLQAYQYVNQDGINTWVPTFKISNNTYSVNAVIDFVNGGADLTINISDLGLDKVPFDSVNNSFAYFNIQATLSNLDLEDMSSVVLPSAVSLEVGDAYFDNSGSFDPGEFPLMLPLTLHAAEFNGTTWAAINDKKTLVYLTISFANPNEVFQAISSNEVGES
jgi:hypothetical protein